MVQPSSRRKGVAKRLLRHVQRRACQVSVEGGLFSPCVLQKHPAAHEENMDLESSDNQAKCRVFTFYDKLPLGRNCCIELLPRIKEANKKEQDRTRCLTDSTYWVCIDQFFLSIPIYIFPLG